MPPKQAQDDENNRQRQAMANSAAARQSALINEMRRNLPAPPPGYQQALAAANPPSAPLSAPPPPAQQPHPASHGYPGFPQGYRAIFDRSDKGICQCPVRGCPKGSIQPLSGRRRCRTHFDSKHSAELAAGRLVDNGDGTYTSPTYNPAAYDYDRFLADARVDAAAHPAGDTSRPALRPRPTHETVQDWQVRPPSPNWAVGGQQPSRQREAQRREEAQAWPDAEEEEDIGFQQPLEPSNFGKAGMRSSYGQAQMMPSYGQRQDYNAFAAPPPQQTMGEAPDPEIQQRLLRMAQEAEVDAWGPLRPLAGQPAYSDQPDPLYSVYSLSGQMGASGGLPSQPGEQMGFASGFGGLQSQPDVQMQSYGYYPAYDANTPREPEYLHEAGQMGQEDEQNGNGAQQFQGQEDEGGEQENWGMRGPYGF